VILWPESPAPFLDKDPRLLGALRGLAVSMRSPVIAGTTSLDPHGNRSDMYNSALFVGLDGEVKDRYDKIHLVPWGEYIPYKHFFSFAKNLTQAAGDMTHGWRRVIFSTDGHRFGVFICYEEIFPDEVRLFVKRGARVLVNISNDGWYGDTCAPWQTLNMSRMRAVENRRWLLRATNTGLTTIIDPYGRLTASVPRHALIALAAKFGYRTDLTFYTVYGDVFAYLCGIISFGIIAAAALATRRKPWRRVKLS
jgi:apolipoprotein N-acyltransferase